MSYPCPLLLVLLLLLAPSSAPAEPETTKPSIQFWRQSSYVFLPPDMQFGLSFKILRLGYGVQSGALVRVQLWTPNHKRDPAAKLATFALRDVCNSSSTPRELHCQASLDCRAIGLHHGFWTTAKLSLDDEQGSAISEHQTSIWIRSVLTPAVLEPPSCWRAEEPLRMQDPDCVWLWMSFKPNQNVVLSLQDFGPREPPRDIANSVTGGAFSLHGGDWGWVGRSTEDSNLLPCLPPVGFVHRMHGSCAVVGSAWHLDHSNFGAEIDAHEVVLRINDPPIEEWAEHVGSRTTHRMLNAKIPWTHFDEGEQLIFRLSKPTSIENLTNACSARTLRPLGLSPALFDYMHSSFAGVLERSRAFVLTTGFAAVVWALHACETVTLYGFGGGRSEGMNGMVQYNDYSWIPRSQDHFTPLHAWDDEAIMLMRLEQAGALRRRFRKDMEEELRCATLGNNGADYGAAPHMIEAHARICKRATETTYTGAGGLDRLLEDDVDVVPSEPKTAIEGAACKAHGEGLAGVDLYDCLYQDWYRKATKKVGRQAMILHDLLMYDGPDSPLHVDGVRPAVVLDAGAGMGAVVHWLRDTQKVSLSAHAGVRAPKADPPSCFWAGQVMEVEAHGVELSRVAVESSPWPELTQLQLLRQGSLDHLPFPDRTFDLVFSHEVLEHVPTTNVPRVLQELVRVSRGRLFFTISMRLGKHDDPAAPHLHVTVQPRGWWDERMADEGCVPDLDLLGFMWRDPAAKHDDHRQWMPYRDPWMFAYKCAVGGDAAAAEAEAHAELQAMRRIPEGCAQHAAAAQSEQLGEMEGCSADGWADVFDPAVYWATDAAKPKETMHKQYLAFLADRFGMVLGSDV